MIVLAVVVYVFLIVLALSLCRVAGDADRALEAQRYERRRRI